VANAQPNHPVMDQLVTSAPSELEGESGWQNTSSQFNDRLDFA
jgi:hypothetical protein